MGSETIGVGSLETLAGTAGPAAVSLPEDGELTAETPGRYVLTGTVLGVGGLGMVRLARDCHLHRHVAIKEIRGLATTEARARLVREARAPAALRHDGIVAVYDAAIRADGTVFIVMDHVPGRTLDRVMDDASTAGARLSLVELLAQVCEAVAYAHARRVIHRDLKPQNVMVTPEGRAVVLDWGLVKQIDQDETPSTEIASPDPLLTRVGATLGTPHYISPEQSAGRTAEIGPPTDVWALGVVLYQLLTGEFPFTGRTAREVFRHLQQDPTPDPRRLNPTAPDELISVLRRALEKAPDARYAEAGAMGADLRAWIGALPVQAHRYTPWGQARRLARRYPREAVLLGVASLALGAGGTVSVSRIRATLAASYQDQALRAWETQDEAATALFGAAALLQGAGADAMGATIAGASAWMPKRGWQTTPRKPCRTLTVSPDGTVVVCQSEHQIETWIDGERRGVLVDADSWVGPCAFLPDGRLVHLTPKGDLVVLRPGDLGRAATLYEGAAPAQSLSVDPAGKVYLLERGGGVVRALPAPAARLSPNVTEERVGVLAASPDGAHLLVSHPGFPTVDLDPETGIRRQTYGGKAYLHAAFLKDGLTFLVAAGRTEGEDRTFRHRWGDSQPTAKGAGIPGGVNGLALSPDGEILAVWGARPAVDLVRPSDETLLHRIRTGSKRVQAAAWDPRGEALYVASTDDGLVRWDFPPGLGQEPEEDYMVSGLAVSPDGTTVATTSNASRVTLWEAATHSARREFTTETFYLGAITFLDDHRVLYTERDGAYVADGTTGARRTVGEDVGALYVTAPSPDGRRIAGGGWGRRVVLFDRSSGEIVRRSARQEGSIGGVAYTVDGLISSGFGELLTLWDPDTLSLRATAPVPDPLYQGLEANPAGTMLAASTIRGVSVFTLPWPPTPLHAFDADDKGIDLTWIDDRRLALISWDRSVRIYDAVDGVELARIPAHPRQGWAVARGPDTRWLYSSGGDGRYRRWDLSWLDRSPQELLTRLRVDLGLVIRGGAITEG